MLRKGVGGGLQYARRVHRLLHVVQSCLQARAYPIFDKVKTVGEEEEEEEYSGEGGDIEADAPSKDVTLSQYQAADMLRPSSVISDFIDFPEAPSGPRATSSVYPSNGRAGLRFVVDLQDEIPLKQLTDVINDLADLTYVGFLASGADSFSGRSNYTPPVTIIVMAETSVSDYKVRAVHYGSLLEVVIVVNASIGAVSLAASRLLSIRRKLAQTRVLESQTDIQVALNQATREAIRGNDPVVSELLDEAIRGRISSIARLPRVVEIEAVEPQSGIDP
jgi:hypothetical protein